MSIALLLAGAFAAQTTNQLTVNAPGVDQIDVAFEELSQGRNHDAVELLEGSALVKDQDPAALINLGTAYARLGQFEMARRNYAAAMSSENRYVLELADGSWVDSRRAARMATTALSQGRTLALK